MLKTLGRLARMYAVFAVPLLVLALAAGYVITSVLQPVHHAGHLVSITEQHDATARVTAALRNERAFTVVAAQADSDAARSDAVTKLGDARQRTQATFTTALNAAANGSAPVEVAQAAAVVRGTQNDVTELRQRIDAGDLTLDEARSGYDAAITGLIGVPVLFAHAAESSTIARAYYGMAQAELLTEALWMQGLAGLDAISEGTVTAAARDRIGAGAVAYADATARLQALNTTSGTPLQVPSLSADFTDAQAALLATPTDEPLPYTFSDYYELVQREAAAHEAASASHLMVATEATTAFAESANQTVLIAGIATTLALLCSSIAMWWFARRLTRGISGMTAAMVAVRDKLPHLADSLMDDQAEDIELPRIALSGNDQVARLAGALNDVTTEITGSMSEQATLRKSVQAMFVNIARRDQVLLGRQIALLDQLEQGEQDPETQTSLYRLSHLATRMRRNAESLLVLAGIETGRRPRQPMVIQDVLQVAASEIEDHSRVDYQATDCDLKMLGHHALSAAHLVAELLENACRYSNPGTRVYVSAWQTEEAVRVQVRDDGIGMNEADVEAANAKIAAPVTSDYLRADKLGLYVVGQLARKLSAHVVIESEQDAGSTARVDLPLELFATPGDPAAAETAPTAVAVQAPTVPAGAAPVIAAVSADASRLLSAVADQVGSTYQPPSGAPELGALDASALSAPDTGFHPALGNTGNGLPSPRKRKTAIGAADSAPANGSAPGGDTQSSGSDGAPGGASGLVGDTHAPTGASHVGQISSRPGNFAFSPDATAAPSDAGPPAQTLPVVTPTASHPATPTVPGGLVGGPGAPSTGVPGATSQAGSTPAGAAPPDAPASADTPGSGHPSKYGPTSSHLDPAGAPSDGHSIFAAHLSGADTPDGLTPAPKSAADAADGGTDAVDSVFGDDWGGTELRHPESESGDDSGFSDSMRTLQEMPADELHPGARAHRDRISARTILPSTAPEKNSPGRRHAPQRSRSADQATDRRKTYRGSQNADLDPRGDHPQDASDAQSAAPSADGAGKKRSWFRLPWRQETPADADQLAHPEADGHPEPEPVANDDSEAPQPAAPAAPATAWAAAQTGGSHSTGNSTLGEYVSAPDAAGTPNVAAGHVVPGHAGASSQASANRHAPSSALGADPAPGHTLGQSAVPGLAPDHASGEGSGHGPGLGQQPLSAPTPGVGHVASPAPSAGADQTPVPGHASAHASGQPTSAEQPTPATHATSDAGQPPVLGGPTPGASQPGADLPGRAPARSQLGDPAEGRPSAADGRAGTPTAGYSGDAPTPGRPFRDAPNVDDQPADASPFSLPLATATGGFEWSGLDTDSAVSGGWTPHFPPSDASPNGGQQLPGRSGPDADPPLVPGLGAAPLIPQQATSPDVADALPQRGAAAPVTGRHTAPASQGAAPAPQDAAFQDLVAGTADPQGDAQPGGGTQGVGAQHPASHDSGQHVAVPQHGASAQGVPAHGGVAHHVAAHDDTVHQMDQPSLAPPAATPDSPRREAWTDHTQSAADALVGPHAPQTAGPRRPEPPSPMEALAQERKTSGRGVSTGIGDSLRQRSELASQAMAELSMLSSYSPEDDAGRRPLARRQRGATAPPPVAGPPRKPSQPRDAGKVRSTLSGFTAGAARGRKPKS